MQFIACAERVPIVWFMRVYCAQIFTTPRSFKFGVAGFIALQFVISSPSCFSTHVKKQTFCCCVPTFKVSEVYLKVVRCDHFLFLVITSLAINLVRSQNDKAHPQIDWCRYPISYQTRRQILSHLIPPYRVGWPTSWGGNLTLWRTRRG